MLSSVAHSRSLRPLSSPVFLRGNDLSFNAVTRAHPLADHGKRTIALGAERADAPLAFRLNVAVRVAPEHGALQVPSVPPRTTWPTSARTERAGAPAWRDVSLPLRGRDPALLALGDLLHWLHVSPTGCGEEREASAYWLQCRQQEQDRARELSTLRRAASDDGEPGLREDDVTAPDLATGGPQNTCIEAVELLQDRGLLSPPIAEKLRSLAPAPGANVAEESLWGARLTAQALRASHVEEPGPVGQVDGPLAAEATPAQLFAECLAAMLELGRHSRDGLLPKAAGQYLVTADLHLPARAEAALPADADRRRRAGLVGAERPADSGRPLLSLSSVDLAGGRPRVVSLG